MSKFEACEQIRICKLVSKLVVLHVPSQLEVSSGDGAALFRGLCLHAGFDTDCIGPAYTPTEVPRV